mgnify:CR=1 FL=1
MSEEFTFERYKETRPEGTLLLLWINSSGDLVFRSTTREADPGPGNKLISFGPAPRDAETRKREHEEWRNEKNNNVASQPKSEAGEKQNRPTDPPQPDLP